jgi:hypothetical protein
MTSKKYMGKYIATKLHVALEVDPEEPVLLEMHQGAHYVIDQTLIELLARSDVKACIAAMVEANVARLPLESLTIEFEADNVRRFVLLRETSQGVMAHVASLTGDAMEVTFRPIRCHLTTAGVAVTGHMTLMDGKAAGFAVGIALLMLHTKGIEKELIVPEPLNRKRRVTGKVEIPRHTVMRIGSVYDREGKEHRVGAGSPMPLHLRIGHARHQAWGPEMKLRRWIYIPPVIVNYRPEEGPVEVRQPKKILAR